eukprot:366503-Chlamydomonas_euryale.AAC.5
MLLFVGGGLAHSKPWSVGGGKVRAVHACLLHGLAAVCERAARQQAQLAEWWVFWSGQLSPCCGSRHGVAYFPSFLNIGSCLRKAAMCACLDVHVHIWRAHDCLDAGYV